MLRTQTTHDASATAKPSQRIWKFAFAIAAGGALVFSMLPGVSFASPVETDSSEGIVQVVDGSGFEAAESATTLTFSNTGITASGEESGYEIDGTNLTITAAGTYTVTGSCSEGTISVKKGVTGVTLVLKDLSLTSSTSAPIVCKKTTETTIIVEGTVNLTSAEDPANETSADADVADAFEGAAIKAKSGASLLITGTGTLNIDASNCKNGIKGAATATVTIGASATDTVTVNVTAANNCIASDGALVINGGTVDVTATEGDGLKSSPDEDDTESAGTLTINGGTASVTTLLQDGIQAAGDLVINGGTITLDCADDAIHGDGDVSILGGTLSIKSGDDGVKAEYVLNIGTQGSSSGPDITVSKSVEGLEGATVNFYSGTANVTSSDDGVNAANADLTGYTYVLNIAGGTLVVNSGGDGLDSNGNINVSGGTTIVYGATGNGNGIFDIGDTGCSWNQTGGTVFGIGTSDMAVYPTSGTYVAFGSGAGMGGMQGGPGQQGGMGGMGGSSVSISAGSTVAIKDASGTTVFETTTPKSGTLVEFASDSLVAGSTYTLYVNGSQVATATATSGNGQQGGMGGQPGDMGGQGGTQPGQPGDMGGQMGTSLSYTRIYGETLYDTAVELSKAAFADGADAAVVCTGDMDIVANGGFADSLAANSLASIVGGPVLLTDDAELTQVTSDELSRLGVETVYVVGGSYVVSDDVVSQLESQGYEVVRIWGEYAPDTASALYDYVSDKLGGFDADGTAIIATTVDFADALSISPYSYQQAYPIFLAPFSTKTVSDADLAAITSSFDKVIIVGGTAVVSQETQDALEAAGVQVVRLAGQNGYDTSAEIANWLTGGTTSVTGMGGMPGDMGGAPGDMGGAPGDMGGMPGDMGGAPGGQGGPGGFGPMEDSSESESEAGTVTTSESTTVDTAAATTYAFGPDQVFTYAKTALATGTLPYDALAGAALQAHNNSPLLLVCDTTTQDGCGSIVNLIRMSVSSQASSVVIFGGPGIISDTTATSVLSGGGGMPM